MSTSHFVAGVSMNMVTSTDISLLLLKPTPPPLHDNDMLKVLNKSHPRKKPRITPTYHLPNQVLNPTTHSKPYHKKKMTMI
jgi:hypothetical protein